MSKINTKNILRYLYDQLTGNFIGFLIGTTAAGLVSQFFETRSIKNLWGLTAKKAVVDKETFSNLEWVISIVIGFIVFEIMTKVVKEKIDKYFPIYKFKVLRWILENGWHEKLKAYNISLNSKRVVLFATVHNAVKNTLAKYSKR